MHQTDPTTTTAAAAATTFAGYKLALFSLPFVASLIAFWLGLHFVPLRSSDPRSDLLGRVLASLVSGFVLGIPTLVLLLQHWPGLFEAGTHLAELAALAPVSGFFAITACVLVLCSIPGPWLVAATFLWLRKTEGQTLPELAQHLRQDIATTAATAHHPSKKGTP